MSKIKSSLELALERTSDIHIDKEAMRRDQALLKGKKAVGAWLANPKDSNLEQLVSRAEAGEQGWVREGMIDALFSNIILPRYETDIQRVPQILGAVKTLAGHAGRKTLSLIDQYAEKFTELFTRYHQTLQQIEQQLREQWEPRLRQKEQLLLQQTGQRVHLTAEQDPEFSKTLGDEINRLDAQYTEAVNQGKQTIRQLL